MAVWNLSMASDFTNCVVKVLFFKLNSNASWLLFKVNITSYVISKVVYILLVQITLFFRQKICLTDLNPGDADWELWLLELLPERGHSDGIFIPMMPMLHDASVPYVAV